ncbi:MAG: hypothetical protein ABI658_02445 [Acidimicrobiales bacterium]
MSELRVDRRGTDLTHGACQSAQHDLVLRRQPFVAVCVGHLDQTEHLLQTSFVEPDDDLIAGPNHRHGSDLVRA